MTKNKLKLSTV